MSLETINESEYTFKAPDWRSQNEYPNHSDGHSLKFWAWQFLRRNKGYQEDWRTYAEKLVLIINEIPEVSPVISIYLLHENTISNEEYFRLMSIIEKRFDMNEIYNMRGSFGRKWGLDRIVNPAKFSLFTFGSVRGGFINSGSRLVSAPIASKEFKYSDDGYEEFKKYETRNYYIPVFDLRLPVDVLRSQFEFILGFRKEFIESGAINPYKGRPQKQVINFQNYLRVLDAIDEGCAIPEIASVILSKQDQDNAKKTVRNWKNAAIKIRDKDYIELPIFDGFN